MTREDAWGGSVTKKNPIGLPIDHRWPPPASFRSASVAGTPHFLVQTLVRYGIAEPPSLGFLVLSDGRLTLHRGGRYDHSSLHPASGDGVSLPLHPATNQSLARLTHGVQQDRSSLLPRGG